MVFARHESLTVGCWRGAGTLDDLEQLFRCYEEQHARYPEGFLAMTILEHGVVLKRDPELMERGREARKAYADWVRRQAYVIPHAGVGGTMLRLMIRGMTVVTPNSDTQVFKRFGEGLAWLGEDEGLRVEAGLEAELAAALKLRESTRVGPRD